jgi:2-phosphosulfolactate phosphatase
VVDVLSFSTAVDIAVSRGGSILPYPLKDSSASRHADSLHAALASSTRGSGYSLSPATLETLPPGYRLVLPSPNGSALCFEARCTHVMTACLRNVKAVAMAALRLGSRFALVPAGEMWSNGELRPCLEDLLGAGAVISLLAGRRSPEAEAASAAFEYFRGDLRGALRGCGSGKELIERGFAEDVELAAELDVSGSAPLMVDGAFRDVGTARPET